MSVGGCSAMAGLSLAALADMGYTVDMTRKRTLTNLYNARPQGLVDAHAQLAAAVVCPAHGWPGEIEDGASGSTEQRVLEVDLDARLASCGNGLYCSMAGVSSRS